ncbi:hypothetical protein P8452_58290 [Trifolium repens]|nr:hypothetical protein QL285_051516 [Trifolium repens]KAK2455530.1 hypothetical protein QL285_002973 [Trifolium repens]WJX74666.1 hypothetical protein P8452_58290 [Trifolium repens]
MSLNPSSLRTCSRSRHRRWNQHLRNKERPQKEEIRYIPNILHFSCEALTATVFRQGEKIESYILHMYWMQKKMEKTEI